MSIMKYKSEIESIIAEFPVVIRTINCICAVAPARRGDLEILGYCLLQWLCGRLPWEDNLNNKDYVRDQKVK